MLVGPVGRLLGDPASIRTQVLGQLALWLLLAAVLLIVRFWEREPVSSLWWKRIAWASVGWAAALALLHVFVVFPATEALRTALGVEGYGSGMKKALAMPVELRLFAVITAGIVEEVLFRGYAVTRLLRLLRNPVSAAIIASAAFAVLHLPMWGPGPSLSFFVGGLVTTGIFIWRRDLWMMIFAHIINDAWGLIVSPSFSRWWA